MTSIKQVIGAVLIAGGSFGLFVACSTTGNSCVTQSDCGADQVCDGGLCTDICATDAECGTGFTCEAATDGTGKVCKESASTTGGTSTTTDTTGGTTTPVEGNTYNYMMVLDTTAGAGCDNSDPGSDLMYIQLLDDSGTGLAFAETVSDEEGTADNDNVNEFIDSSILDGAAPTLKDESCVDGFTDVNVYSLGCDGKVSFKFKSSTPAPFTVIGGEHSVVVGEYGTQCDGSADDSYELYGCTDDVDAAAGGFDSCTVLISGSGEGITNFVVAAE